jgi:hypothetical protein
LSILPAGYKLSPAAKRRVLIVLTVFATAFVGQVTTLTGPVSLKALVAALAAGGAAVVHYLANTYGPTVEPTPAPVPAPPATPTP